MSRETKENYDYGYLDEAFDDAKGEEELKAAQKANNRGCLIIVIVVVLVVVLLGLGMCGAAVFLGTDLSV